MIAIGMGPVVLGAGIYFKWRTERTYLDSKLWQADKAIHVWQADRAII